VTEFVRAFVKSYKQLPLNVWQMQTKFRDEPRPRSGLLRVREFIMKDAYSLDADEAGLDKSFQAMRAAYKSIYARCGVPAIEVDADSGAIGGSESIEFTVPCDAGEDVVVTSDKGNYAANVEKAAIGERAFDLEGEPTGELEKVHTPDMPGIELVCKHLKVKPPRMLKTLVFTRSDGKGFVIGVVPGDKQVTAAKLQAAAGVGPIELDEASARSAGFAIGYVGPHVVNDREDTMLVVDPDAAQGGFWATGANERDHHVKHFNWARDVETKPVVADIRDAVDGDPSPKNDGGVLKESRGVEVGHVFKLGTVYSEKMVATFLDENNAEKPVIMGCYGIGVGRILLSAVETSHDDRGIIWPINIAPCEVVVTPIKYEGVAKTKADMIYDELQSKGVDVLLDDRDDRPGSKFADADLIGIPLRVVVGDRGLEKEGGGVVEVKERQSGETHEVPVDGVVDAVIKRLASLRR
jgi:prolyl-tRNA synthetase